MKVSRIIAILLITTALGHIKIIAQDHRTDHIHSDRLRGGITFDYGGTFLQKDPKNYVKRLNYASFSIFKTYKNVSIELNVSGMNGPLVNKPPSYPFNFDYDWLYIIHTNLGVKYHWKTISNFMFNSTITAGIGMNGIHALNAPIYYIPPQADISINQEIGYRFKLAKKVSDADNYLYLGVNLGIYPFVFRNVFESNSVLTFLNFGVGYLFYK